MFTTLISKRSGWLGLLLLVALVLAVPAWCAASIGQVAVVTGKVDVLRGGQLPAQTLAVGDPVNVGDFIRTKSDSLAEIQFHDGNRIKIGPRSRVDISEYAADRDTRTLALARGKVEAVVAPPTAADSRERPKRFEIHTPNAVAGVRGTEFQIFFESNTTGVLVRMVHEGDSVYAFNLLYPDQMVTVPAGNLTLIHDRGLPSPPRPAGAGELEMFGALIQQMWDSGALVAALGGSLPEVLTLPELPPFSEVFSSVQVGTVTMSGTATGVQGLFDLSVTMLTNFYAPSTDVAPTYWGGSVSGTWGLPTPTAAPPFDPTGTSVFLSGSGPDSAFASADFFVTGWNSGTGQWNADLVAGSGVTAITPTGGGVSFSFDGLAGGGGATSLDAGTFSGTASGTATGQGPLP